MAPPFSPPPSAAADVVVDDGQARFTAAGLKRAGAAVADGLRRRGLVPGDRVALVVRGSAEAVAVVFGCFSAGFVVVPLNPGYQRAEIDHVLADSGAKVVVVDEPCPALSTALPIVSSAELLAGEGGEGGGVDAEDALLLYTSGTTGRSKGCLHTRGSIRGGIDALMALWGIGPGDEVVHALPLFHVHGLLVATVGPLLAGARVRLLRSFSPASVVDAVRSGSTVLMTVPTMVHRILGHLDEKPTDNEVLRRLRLFTCGSAALSAEMLARAREKLGLVLLERYGMTETLITLSNPLDGERRPGSVGRPVPGVETRVVDDELQVRGPGLMRGYWRRPDADAESFSDGWFKTGDVVSVDADGYVRIVGRASQDILKVGGYKISAREIEEEVAKHASVSECCVVGVPDEEWGEKIVAVVVLRPGCSLSVEEAQQAVQLHAAKKPRAVVCFSSLPRNAMGKVMKSEVKKMLASEAKKY